MRLTPHMEMVLMVILCDMRRIEAAGEGIARRLLAEDDSAAAEADLEGSEIVDSTNPDLLPIQFPLEDPMAEEPEVNRSE